jgi:DNA-binding NarL/FixJ family response regulator
VTIRLVLADDHPIVLKGLVDLFQSSGEFAVVGTADTGPAALAAVRTHRPDVVVLDIRMPGQSGLEVAGDILRDHLPTRIVLLSVEITDNQTLEAIRLGVHGILLKHMATRLLVECVRKVHAGGRWVEQESLRRAMEGLLQREVASQPEATLLTLAEDRVVEILASGARNKEIADRLNISESTVKNHLHNIYVKLKVSSRRELLRWYEANRRGRPGRR